MLELNWGTVRQASLLELIDAAAANGFGSITVPPPLLAAAVDAGHPVAEIRARIDHAGLSVGYIDAVTSGLPGQPSGTDAAAYRSTLDDCLAAAEALGVGAVNITHFGGQPAPLGELADGVGEMAARARRAGVRAVVEFLPGTGIPDLATTERLLAEIGDPALGILFDTWHHYRSVPSIDAGADIPFDRIGALQLSDMPADRVGCWQAGDPHVPERNRTYRQMTGRYLLPGDGVLPLAAIVAGVVAARPDVGLGIEVFSDDLRAMTVAEAAAAAAASLQPWR